MRNSGFSDKLDLEIDELIAGGRVLATTDPDSLVAIAQELTRTPRPVFKQSLKKDLLGPIAGQQGESDELCRQLTAIAILPSLGAEPWRMFPADHRSFLVSFGSHLAVVLLIASGIWVGARPTIKKTTRNPEVIFSQPGSGGGGSGDRSHLHTSQGAPTVSSHVPLAPPLVVVRNRHPQLVVPASLAPPEIPLPPGKTPGDLTAITVVPSNGTGKGGATGEGVGKGLGAGEGVGVGLGLDHGTGGKVFSPGLGIEPPHAIYQPDPEYSEEERKMRLEGRVVVSLIVDHQGRPRNVRVLRSLGMGLDEKALEAIKSWRFEPGKKDGQSVAVEVNVEIQFRLY